MRTLESADLSEKLSSLCVDYHDAVGASDIQKMGRVIDFEVVPTAIAAELPSVADPEGGLRGRHCCDGK
jgi:hypothetical protein